MMKLILLSALLSMVSVFSFAKPSSLNSSSGLRTEMNKMDMAILTIKKTTSPNEALNAVYQIRSSATKSQSMIPKNINDDKSLINYYKGDLNDIVAITYKLEKAIKDENFKAIRPLLIELNQIKSSGHRSFKN
jgi:hypothetical protein